jgi:hypothetical protein
MRNSGHFRGRNEASLFRVFRPFRRVVRARRA